MPTTISLEDVRGRVDYGIITIREDEFAAVFNRLPERSTVYGGKQLYEYATCRVDGGGTRNVAVVRCPSQGENVSQSVTGHMIRELQPRVLLLVGIAGGIPSDEFTLGDVLLASHLHDFSVTAALQGGQAQMNVSGGPLHRSVSNLLAHLPALLHRLPDWNAEESILDEVPAVNLPDTNSDCVYGSDEWKKKVVASLNLHFPEGRNRRRPKAYVGPTASSNQLVKDADLVAQWQEAARSITHIEMELAGVVRAARDAHEEVPVIAIRGLSDIVGFRRDPGWTGYACHSAAAFCVAMIKSRIFEEATPWDWESPRLIQGKVTAVNEWLGGAPERVSSSPVPGILILGPGGVGKSTLGRFLSGNEDRSPFASPKEYDESILVEQYLLSEKGGPEAMIVVPPGQEHRRAADWDELYRHLREGQFHGIIILASYGYHSLGQMRWREHPLAKASKKMTQKSFMNGYHCCPVKSRRVSIGYDS